MKKLYFSFFIFPYLCLAQPRPTSDGEIANFLNKLGPTFKVQIPSDSLIQEILKCAKKADIVRWEFADITNDDKDDLLVNLASGWQVYPIIVVNWTPQLDSTSAEVHEFPGDPFQSCNYIQSNQISESKTVKYSRNRNFEVLDSLGQKTYEVKFLQTDLIYKSGAFIEYNPKPSSKEIRSIKFVRLGCFFGCPQYELKIIENGIAYLKPMKYMGKNKRKQMATTMYKR